MEPNEEWHMALQCRVQPLLAKVAGSRRHCRDILKYHVIPGTEFVSTGAEAEEEKVGTCRALNIFGHRPLQATRT